MATLDASPLDRVLVQRSGQLRKSDAPLLELSA